MSRLRETAVLEGHTERVWCVAWSPDGRLLASSSSDKVCAALLSVTQRTLQRGTFVAVAEITCRAESMTAGLVGLLQASCPLYLQDCKRTVGGALSSHQFVRYRPAVGLRNMSSTTTTRRDGCFFSRF